MDVDHSAATGRGPGPAGDAAPRAALVLSGGGARGAYEAGVLSVLFEEIYPDLPPGFEFDIVSGTSVGAIHAAYVAASAHLEGMARSRPIVDTWRGMVLDHVLQLSAGDLLGIPLRALGLSWLQRRARRPDRGKGKRDDVVGGLVDVSPLEGLVAARIPWARLRDNLEGGRPGALCVSCTEVRTGRVTVFMDGRLAIAAPWEFDPNAQAICTEITPLHVRASAAIPFLFPAVRVGERYYVDGGLRMNTPLSPALRLRSDRVLVVALKHRPGSSQGLPAYPEEVITQPAFLMGKVLNALMLDQLDYEVHRVELVNAWIRQGTEVYGEDFLERMNAAVRATRGVGYRRVELRTIRPSQDIGMIASRCYKRSGAQQLGRLPALLARLALHGVPEDESDLLSYLYFDRCFTTDLVELGREDARSQRDEIVGMLTGSSLD
jgi:NTE family protein